MSQEYTRVTSTSSLVPGEEANVILDARKLMCTCMQQCQSRPYICYDWTATTLIQPAGIFLGCATLRILPVYLITFHKLLVYLLRAVLL